MLIENRYWAFTFVLLLAFSSKAFSQPKSELPVNVTYTFSNGQQDWTPIRIPPQSAGEVIARYTDSVGHIASGCLEMMSPAPSNRAVGGWRSPRIAARPGTSYRAEIWVRGIETDSTLNVLLQAWGKGKREFLWKKMDKHPLRVDSEEWIRMETVLEAPAKTASIDLWLMPSEGGLIQVDDVRISEFGDAIPIVEPGIFELTGKYRLVSKPGSTPRFRFPIPLDYGEQVPLTFSIVSPSKRIDSIQLIEDRTDNWIVEVAFQEFTDPFDGEFEWRSLVLCNKREFEPFPDLATLPENWPDELAKWLKSTKCVQVRDERIQAEAKAIRDAVKDPTNVVELIEGTVNQMREIQNRPKEKRASFLGAVQELDQRGSCTSAANLMSALFRANRVPARVVAGYPGWSGPLHTHYIVEAYIPKYGWFPIESTHLKTAWQPFEQIQVSIIPPEYEDRSEARASAVGGVPYLSLTERLSSGNWRLTGSLLSHGSADHVCRPVVNFVDTVNSEDIWRASMKQARQHWQQYLLRAQQNPELMFKPDIRFDGVATLPDVVEALSLTNSSLKD